MNLGTTIVEYQWPTTTANPRWHIVRCVHGADLGVRECLRRINFEVYVPVLRVMAPVPNRELTANKRNQGLMRPKDVVMFPTYVFVRFDRSEGRHFEVFKVLGIDGLYCGANKEPVEVPDELVQGWRSLEVNGAIPGHLQVTETPFKIGETVKVVDGAFAGQIGTVETLDETGRISLLLDLLGRKTRVSTNFDHVENLKTAAS